MRRWHGAATIVVASADAIHDAKLLIVLRRIMMMVVGRWCGALGRWVVGLRILIVASDRWAALGRRSIESRVDRSGGENEISEWTDLVKSLKCCWCFVWFMFKQFWNVLCKRSNQINNEFLNANFNWIPSFHLPVTRRILQRVLRVSDEEHQHRRDGCQCRADIVARPARRQRSIVEKSRQRDWY